MHIHPHNVTFGSSLMGCCALQSLNHQRRPVRAYNPACMGLSVVFSRVHRLSLCFTMQTNPGAPVESAAAAQPGFMYEVAWQASAAVPAATSALTGEGTASWWRQHRAEITGVSGSPAASTVQYGRLRNSTMVPPANVQHWQGNVTWSPASAQAAGSRKLPLPAAAGDPAAVTQGLELLQRLLAAGQTAASGISLCTKGGLPAASSSSDITGGASMSGAAAPAWGLARVAALEYADCRWHGADASRYTQQASEVLLRHAESNVSMNAAQQ